MDIARCVLAAMLLFSAQVFAASDLDKPIEPTRPTVRSEIYRGTQALQVCGGGIDISSECVYAIQNKNVQQNTATDAFNAGLYFGAWMQEAIMEHSVRSVTGKSIASDATRYFKRMKEYQTKLRIDDAALCEAARMVCKNVLPDMVEWESKLKAP